MSDEFPLVPLGDVLTKSEEWVELQPDARYKQVTVRMWGQGVVERNEVSGVEIAATKRFVVRPGQFILSRIDARNGALGLVPETLDGGVVSNDFPAFNVNAERLLPAYLGWMSRTSEFVDRCRAASEGTTNRVRLNEQRFLAATIPLPPLAEQRRIVARIEALAEKIAEARGLRRGAVAEIKALFISTQRVVFDLDGARKLPLEEACSDIIDYRGRTPPISNEGVPHLTSANIRNGQIDWHTDKYVTEETYDTFMTRGLPKRDDVIFTMEAPLGEAAVIPDTRRFSMAQRTLLLRGAEGVLLGEYLAKVLMSPSLREAIYAQATGTTVKGIASKRLKKILIPIPTIDEQRRIVAYLDDLQAKVDALKALQAETAAELDALLPAVLDKAFKGEL